MANRTVAMSVGAALVATSIGASLYTASSAETARQAITAAYDPTTRHGELAVRVDAGGADVTALAAVAPGTPAQVLTVSDSGMPVWRDPTSGGTVTGLLADRPAAAAGREGQRYYATDAAAGLELSECVHKGGATYAWEVVSYGVTATGVALTQAATAADARTALGAWPGAVTVEDMTGTGWTTTAGASTSATWSGGVLTLSAASGATGRVEVKRASPLSSTAHAWDYAARIDVTAGDTTSGTGYVLILVASDANNFVYYLLSQDGTTRLVYKIAGTETLLGNVAGPSSGQRTGAQLWLRLRGDVSGRWVALWGEGSSGSLPTVWTRTHAADVAGLTAAVPATSALEIRVGSVGGAPLTATHTVDVLDIRSSWSGAL